MFRQVLRSGPCNTNGYKSCEKYTLGGTLGRFTNHRPSRLCKVLSGSDKFYAGTLDAINLRRSKQRRKGFSSVSRSIQSETFALTYRLPLTGFALPDVHWAAYDLSELKSWSSRLSGQGHTPAGDNHPPLPAFFWCRGPRLSSVSW